MKDRLAFSFDNNQSSDDEDIDIKVVAGPSKSKA
jgi:hypothetical protein